MCVTEPHPMFSSSEVSQKRITLPRTLIYESWEVSNTPKRPSRQVELGSRLTCPDEYLDWPPGGQKSQVDVLLQTRILYRADIRFVL